MGKQLVSVYIVNGIRGECGGGACVCYLTCHDYPSLVEGVLVEVFAHYY